MKDNEDILKEAVWRAKEARDLDELEKVRIFYLGRKGKLTELLRGLKEATMEEKRRMGSRLNEVKKEIEGVYQVKKDGFLNTPKKKFGFDVTLPGKKTEIGSEHILSIVLDDILDIFKSLNFSVALGPEVESEYYNFDALNIPPFHPARDMWDTFWVKSSDETEKKNRYLLRTHTSPVQIRFMKEHKPPFKVVAPGRVFRYEATDSSHEINFYQVEGLMVGEGVSLANLKFIIKQLFNSFFGQDLEYRFRPSYFPFVEPGIEVDIKMKKGGEWLEVMGAGMVHRKVLEQVKIDPDKWQGFALGLGVERLAMIKYGIPNIRQFYGADLRFIKQF